MLWSSHDYGEAKRAELYRIIERLIGELDRVRAENARLQAEVEQLTLRVKELEAEVAGRGPGSPRPASWIKKNTPERSDPRGPRKKRDHNFARRRGIPKRQVVHAAERCPRCECTLGGGTL